MYKVGDNVMVRINDMKSRGATIESTTDDNLEIQVKYDSGPTDTIPVSKIEKKPELTVATKYDTGKTRLELIPVSGIEGIGRAMTFGSIKYDDNNWAKGFNYSRLCGSAMRHLVAWLSGEDKDPESGLSHLDHLGACVVMLIAHETEGLGYDDRRKVKKSN